MKVLHETCLEYFRRRLSEGWKCVSLEGYKAILLSPDGIRRELDLRNDVETLRPNAAGDENAISFQFPADSFPATDHWNKVDEVDSDGDTTYVGTNVVAYERDLYNIADHSVGSGTINKITVYAVARYAIYSDQVSLKIAMKTGGVAYEGSEEQLTSGWASYSKEWATNPGNAHAWTWDEIDALQIGIALRECDTVDHCPSLCTQVYVEVDYTYVPPAPPAPPVVEEAAAPEYQKRETARIGTEAQTTLEGIVSRLTEVSIDSGDATSGSLITIVDTTKNWEVDKWKDAIVEVEVDDIHYYRTISSNTADTLTIVTLPAGHPVAAGDHYNIRLSVRIATISGQAVKISGETVIAKVSGETIIGKISGEIVYVSGQPVKVSGQTVTVSSGAISVVSGEIHVLSGQLIAKVSGEAVHVSSGHITIDSGQVIAKISGETVIAKVSGQTVTVSSGAISIVSGHVHVVSGQLIAKVSGEVMQIVLPTEVKTGLIRSIASASGGEVLHSGAVKAAQIKADKDNSGCIVIGGATNRPWYEARCSGLGFVLDPGEAKSEDIDDFNRIYVVAQISGDQISFLGVN